MHKELSASHYMSADRDQVRVVEYVEDHVCVLWYAAENSLSLRGLAQAAIMGQGVEVSLAQLTA